MVDAELDATAAACQAPAIGIELVKTAPRIWEVCAVSPAGPVRWVIDGQTAPAPPDPRAVAIGGDGVRVRALYWTGSGGTEWPLLSCGNCDLIESVRLPGTTTLAWTGPGYGMGRPLELEVRLDGASVSTEDGVAVHGQRVEFRHTVVSYAPGEVLTTDSLRRPVLARETVVAIDGTGSRYDAMLTVLDDHEIGIAYHGRPEGIATCIGGLLDGYVTSLGATWAIPDCEPSSSNRYSYPPMQAWVEMTSTVEPVRVRVTSDTEQPWVCIQVSAIDGKLKCYGRPVNSYGSPLYRTKGDVIQYGHTIAVGLGIDTASTASGSVTVEPAR